MDLWDSLRVLARRWYITLPMLALTVVAAMQAKNRVALQWETSAIVSFFGPNQVEVEDPVSGTVTENVNPLIGGGSAETASQVVTIEVDGDETRNRLEQEGLSTDYSFSSDRRSSIVQIDVIGATPSQSRETTLRLMDVFDQTLRELQDTFDVPEPKRAQIRRLTTSDTTPSSGARTRVQIVVLGVGIALTAAAAFMVEGVVWLFRNWRNPQRVGSQYALPPGIVQPTMGVQQYAVQPVLVPPPAQLQQVAGAGNGQAQPHAAPAAAQETEVTESAAPAAAASASPAATGPIDDDAEASSTASVTPMPARAEVVATAPGAPASPKRAKLRDRFRKSSRDTTTTPLPPARADKPAAAAETRPTRQAPAPARSGADDRRRRPPRSGPSRTPTRTRTVSRGERSSGPQARQNRPTPTEEPAASSPSDRGGGEQSDEQSLEHHGSAR